MSYENQTSGSNARSLLARFDFRHLLTTTLVLVSATILLGVATKATGSGLACEAQWPQCDAGPFNLLPANLPSFYEWFHRFVAMFAGFAIIGTAVAAWRSPTVDRRITALVVLGMALTPVQVYLGRETVLEYALPILSLHFWTAITIFTLFVAATVLAWERTFSTAHVTGALALGALAVPFHAALSPAFVGDLSSQSPEMQTAQYGVTLVLLAAAVVALLVGRWEFEDARIVGLLGVTTIVAVVTAYLARQAANPAIEVLYLGAAAVLFLVFVAGAVLTRRAASTARQLA
ncbi:cytochrome oxidase assembly protein [Natrialbaceae archaeon GCM10025810]|uniref:cytochrome oxidase assembly protein n=1 Tax=Halovalidus salilacus TaxID=3075124 RepID=UPI00360B5859